MIVTRILAKGAFRKRFVKSYEGENSVHGKRYLAVDAWIVYLAPFKEPVILQIPLSLSKGDRFLQNLRGARRVLLFPGSYGLFQLAVQYVRKPVLGWIEQRMTIFDRPSNLISGCSHRY